MFQRLGRLVIRFRFLVVVLWVVAATCCYLFTPTLQEVGTSDQTGFLPAKTETMEVGALLSEAFPADASLSQAMVVLSRVGGLSAADRAFAASLSEMLAGAGAPAGLRDEIAEVVTAENRPEFASSLQSKDGVVEIVQVSLKGAAYDRRANLAVDAIRQELRKHLPAGLQVNVTGNAGVGADYTAAIVSGTDKTTLVTVALVVVILLLIYRAPLAALAPLVTIGIAWVVSRGVLGLLAQAGWHISSLLDSFVVVLVFGVGTDYTIFLVSRFREELGRAGWREAAERSVGRIGSVIAASAATVIVGLSAMAVARFGLIKTTGPALAIAIAITLLAGLTLTPAYLGIFGRYLFWPLHRNIDPGDGRRGPWARLSRGVTRSPVVAAVILLGLLAAPAMALPQLKSDFNLMQELPAGGDGRVGFQVVAEHYDQGQLLPVTVIVEAPGKDLSSPESMALLRHTGELLAAFPGVGRVTSLVSPTGDGAIPDGLRPSVQLRQIADQLLAPGDQQEALRALLEPDALSGLDSAVSYVNGLGVAFLDLAEVDGYRAAAADLVEMRAAVAQVRAGLQVGTQLNFIAAAIASGSSQTDQAELLSILQKYLDDLASGYPEVLGTSAYQGAAAALDGMTRGVDADPVTRLRDSLVALAGEFADRPDAYLISEALAASPQSRALVEQLGVLNERLPSEIEALAAKFDGEMIDLFLPSGISGASGDQLAQLERGYLSPDREVTRLLVTLSGDPYSNQAMDSVAELRGSVHVEAATYGEGARVLVGGNTAAFVDIRKTIGEDFLRVAAITVAGVLLVLVLLLRAIVAPLYLVATVLLSWAGSLGLATLLFQNLLGHSGVNYFLPLIVFVLLVAIGSDYNIFLMSRVREESGRYAIREAIQVASARTGTVITSAGIILAGTFAAMAIAPLRLMVQIGVAVALGVMVDTFIVRTLLVPAITAWLGHWAWWPWHRARPEKGPRIEG